MSTNEIAEAVVEWARATIPALNGGYAYPPTGKEQPLPDVVVDVEATAVLTDDPAFPWRDIQQAWVKRYDTTLSFMVDNSDPAAAAANLRDMADLAEAAIVQDGTLGGRVPFCSPFVTFDYTPPFVEYEDGTRGREMTMTLSVGEMIEEKL